MTNIDTAANAPRPPAGSPPLGVGGLISAAFSALFKRFWLFLLLGLLVILGVFLVLALAFGATILGGSALSGLAQGDVGDFATAGAPVVIGLLALVGLFLAGTFTQAYQTAAGYDVFMAQDRGWGHYIRVGFSRMVPLFVVYVVSIVVIVAAFFGFAFVFQAIGLPGWIIVILFGIAGIGILMLFSLVVPAVVVEGRWFSAFGRSWSLSRGYRWPILGFIVALLLIAFGIALVLGGVLGGIVAASGSEAVAVAAIVLQVLNFAIQILVTALFLIGYAVLFARLRNIKEGVTPDNVAATFD